jgi:hypothetical protein
MKSLRTTTRQKVMIHEEVDRFNPIRNRCIIQNQSIHSSQDEIQDLILVATFRDAEKLLNLSRNLTLLIHPKTEISSAFEQKFRIVRDHPAEPCQGILVLTESLPLVDHARIRTIIRADGGNGFLSGWNPTHWSVGMSEQAVPIKLIDFDDAFQPELRKRSRLRQRAYLEHGWHLSNPQLEFQAWTHTRPQPLGGKQ